MNWSGIQSKLGVFARFLSVALPLSMLCFFSSLWLFEANAYEKALAELEDTLNRQIHNHAQLISEAVANKAPEQVQLLSASLAEHEVVGYLAITDNRGKLLYSAGQIAAADTIEQSTAILHIDEQGSRIVGELSMMLTMDQALEQIAAQKQATLVLFLSLLLAILFASSLAYWTAVGVPLKRLTLAIQHSRAGGEFVPIAPGGKDQLGVIIDEYNKMQMAAERHNTELIEQQKNLEQQVADRTLDLQQELDDHADTLKKLAYQAHHDVLTDLPNRTAFREAVENSVRQVQASNNTGALCFLDLDRFKLVNDTYGHAAGDSFLIAISDKIKSCLRDQDILARLGGDEFGLLLPDIEPDQAVEFCQQLIDTVSQFRCDWKGHLLHVGMSAGIAVVDQHTEDYAQLMKIADISCYVAKNEGGGKAHCSTADSPQARSHSKALFLAQEVESALAQNRLELRQQPICAIGTTEPRSWMKILVWCRSSSGEIFKDSEFLPAAELFGIVQNIDRWLVEKLVRALSTEKAEVPDIISLGLSGQSICDPRFLEFMVEQINRIKPQANRLCFEITETSTISSFDTAANFIEQLRALGCSFALDDFGAGSSSFLHLKNLRFDYLKIDGSYTTEIANNNSDQEMVLAMKAIADSYWLITIADSVSDEASLKVIESSGIQYAQGPLFGDPAPLDWLPE